MATVKSFTSLEQSKKLAEILPLDSADGVLCEYDDGSWHYEEWVDKPATSRHEQICWSLAALLGVLPFVDFTTPQLIGTPKTLYRCMYNDDLKSHAYDNPIDACYEMILKLKEKNLL